VPGSAASAGGTYCPPLTIARALARSRSLSAASSCSCSTLNVESSSRSSSSYSGLSERTLRPHFTDPDDPLPHYRVNGCVLVRKREFDPWLRQVDGHVAMHSRSRNATFDARRGGREEYPRLRETDEGATRHDDHDPLRRQPEPSPQVENERTTSEHYFKFQLSAATKHYADEIAGSRGERRLGNSRTSTRRKWTGATWRAMARLGTRPYYN
jgi:hypothetical protein